MFNQLYSKVFWNSLAILLLYSVINNAQVPIYDYDLQANQSILLDNYTTIFGQFPSGMNSATISGNPTMPIQGALVMYVDNSTTGNNVKFAYIPSGETLFFQPGPGGNSSYKFASFLVDWSLLADNSGSIDVQFSDGRNFTMQGNQSILLDDLTQFPILGGFQDGVTYRVEVTGNPNMPQHSVFVMYIDNGEHKFDVIPIGETLTFTPGSGYYKFSAFQVDWSNVGDNFNSTNIKIYDDGATDVEEFYSGIPNTHQLIQNYPNPFNASTIIKFQISGAGFVTLKVYDVLGNKVATLVNEDKEQGRYSITFDAPNSPSGVYIYELKINNYLSNKKMILMK